MKNKIVITLLLCFASIISFAQQQLVLVNPREITITIQDRVTDSIEKVIIQKITFTATIMGCGKPRHIQISDWETFRKQTKKHKIKFRKITTSYDLQQNGNKFYFRTEHFQEKYCLGKPLPEQPVTIKATLYKIVTKNKTTDLVIINKVEAYKK